MDHMKIQVCLKEKNKVWFVKVKLGQVSRLELNFQQ